MDYIAWPSEQLETLCPSYVLEDMTTEDQALMSKSAETESFEGELLHSLSRDPLNMELIERMAKQYRGMLLNNLGD